MGVELLRFDMSEYMEKHTVSRLIGAPPGYVGFDQGGLLTDGIDQHPHCVLLLDEIEKAHPDLFNILLQVMDHGKLTDHNGKSVDFRNVILIMTTNAGASDMAQAADRLRPRQARGRGHGGDQPHVHAGVPQPARCGHPVRRPAAGDHRARWSRSSCSSSRRSLPTAASPSSSRRRRRKWLAEKGYDEKFGARPLARVIQEHIKKPLADELLFGKLEHGGTVKVLVAGEGEDRELAFEYFPADPIQARPRPRARTTTRMTTRTSRRPSSPRPRRARRCPAPRTRRSVPKTTGTVPSVPRRKPD